MPTTKQLTLAELATFAAERIEPKQSIYTDSLLVRDLSTTEDLNPSGRVLRYPPDHETFIKAVKDWLDGKRYELHIYRHPKDSETSVVMWNTDNVEDDDEPEASVGEAVGPRQHAEATAILTAFYSAFKEQE